MEYKCYFCNSTIDSDVKNNYSCPKCGDISLTKEAAEDIPGEKFSKEKKGIIGIWLRNKSEKQKSKQISKQLTLDDLHTIIKQYSPLEPLEKMDNALLNIEKASPFVGAEVNIDYENDYPYYHCVNAQELRYIIIKLLKQQELIHSDVPSHVTLTAKGYEKLSNIKKHGKDSRQCFVAMWFAPEMDVIYESAIKPAIEYVEEGETESRFRAIKIDNIEHINDINDEIIAAIRRSRFMVCDLTGYRGGVYFEAGFAKGLGLDVIYTCRKDWIEPDIMKDKKSNEVKVLYDSQGKEVQIKKEGIHFDIEHINRIEWEEGKPGEFKENLVKRIKANII